jgi:inhibitor of KinA sporulation pathway (predicted exonuclease)
MTIQKTIDQAVALSKMAEEFYRLTGQYDPVLDDCQIMTEDGIWHDLGRIRLSNLPAFQVVQYDRP